MVNNLDTPNENMPAEPAMTIRTTEASDKLERLELGAVQARAVQPDS